MDDRPTIGINTVTIDRSQATKIRGATVDRDRPVCESGELPDGEIAAVEGEAGIAERCQAGVERNRPARLRSEFERSAGLSNQTAEVDLSSARNVERFDPS